MRALRQPQDAQGVGLAEIGFATRLKDDLSLSNDVHGRLDSSPHRPGTIVNDDRLAWGQARHTWPVNRADDQST